MSDSSRFGHSSIEQAGGGAGAGLFAFADPPALSSGPQTIIHPERGGSTPLPAGTPSADSSIWSKLFPQAAHPVDPQAVQDVAGVELGHFVIERRIGSGGMGAVFRAVDKRLDRTVALKILGPNQSNDPASIQRFHNEARASARLDHDNIARVFYSGEDKGIHFIAYEFVVGTTIRDLIRQSASGRLPSADAVNFALQMAAAIRHTWAAGVVHRDIKPSNIIVSANGRAKLVDLGLARKQESDSVSDLTIAGTTLGTFDYISPEQAKDPRKVDVRSDIYSLGCTLYHMLTGSPPYPEGTVLQKLLDHQDARLPDPREKNPSISRQLAAVVQKMMASNPDDRYQRPDDVMADLMILAASFGLRAASPDGVVWSVPKITRPMFWERNIGWIATAAVLLAIVVFLNRHPLTDPQLANDTPNDVSPAGQAESPDPPRETQSAANNRRETPPLTDPDVVFGPTTNDDMLQYADKSAFGNPAEGLPKPVDPLLLPSPEAYKAPVAVNTDDDLRPVEAPKPLPALTAVARDESPQTPTGPGTSPPRVELPAVALMSESGNVEPYPTLEAACRSAVDGSVILLNYDGRRVAPPERRMKIENKRVTIRAGKRADGTSFRPQLVFDGSPKSSDGETRMFTLVGGSIKIINVDLRITVRDAVNTDQWAAFSCIGANRVRLQGTQITFANSANRPAAVFELKPGSRLDKMSSNMPGSSSSQTTEIEVVESMVRGNCDVFAIKQTDPGRFKVDHSIVAVGGALLAVSGDRDMPQQSAELELQIDHVTCLVGNGFLTMDSGEESRELLPVTVAASNNIFATKTAAPFVYMTGNTNSQDFGSRLRWDGEKNLFDGFARMWVVRPTSVASGLDDHGFQQWLRLWNSDTEVSITEHESFWRRRDAWSNKPPSEIEAPDFSLDDEHEHPTISEGTDGQTVGADLAQFEALLTATADVEEFPKAEGED